MQVRAVVHDTPDKTIRVAPAGFGVAWGRQELPFHASASAPAVSLPTVVQALAAVHDTPDSWLNVAPGLGVGWIFQEVPFQDSASVTSVPALLT